MKFKKGQSGNPHGRPTKSGLPLCIYVISHPHGFYKIGFTRDINNRLRGLQVGSPYELKVVKLVECQNSFEVEQRIKWGYLFNKRIRGEWYELDESELEDVIKIINETAIQVN